VQASIPAAGHRLIDLGTSSEPERQDLEMYAGPIEDLVRHEVSQEHEQVLYEY
jgi:hypothetical protein